MDVTYTKGFLQPQGISRFDNISNEKAAGGIVGIGEGTSKNDDILEKIIITDVHRTESRSEIERSDGSRRGFARTGGFTDRTNDSLMVIVRNAIIRG